MGLPLNEQPLELREDLGCRGGTGTDSTTENIRNSYSWVLYEKADEYVAQFKFTVLLMPSGTHKITGIPFQTEVYESSHVVEDADLKVNNCLSMSALVYKNRPNIHDLEINRDYSNITWEYGEDPHTVEAENLKREKMLEDFEKLFFKVTVPGVEKEFHSKIHTSRRSNVTVSRLELNSLISRFGHGRENAYKPNILVKAKPKERTEPSFTDTETDSSLQVVKVTVVDPNTNINFGSEERGTR
ncbi:hypothetical protein QAD02_013049 [Eretmocerus hayati]|uniref:Uncharacterized protein n=1 Tax=Eretmocerus hayati TaxID=131215 RepID=A0ACC2P4A4_9HYME|nr:hypothetical protein QAD02_013049 [Eretmocerus hayati]